MNENLKYFFISRLGKISKSARLSTYLSRKWDLFRMFRLPYVGCYEQSEGAYNEAYNDGFKTLLVDVRQTRDKHFVCWHDDDVSAVAEENGRRLKNTWKISEHELSEIKNLIFGKTFLNKGGRIVEMEQILRFCQERNLMLECELKSYWNKEDCIKFGKIVKKYNMENRLIVHRNQGEEEMLVSLGNELPSAYLSRTANGMVRAEEMIDIDVPNKKFITITNFRGRKPKMLNEVTLKKLKESGIGIIFSEVKSKRDIREIEKYIHQISFCATRFMF